jgi:hypothetical protein
MQCVTLKKKKKEKGGIAVVLQRGSIVISDLVSGDFRYAWLVIPGFTFKTIVLMT